jgi:hypothetical protein
MRTTQLLPLMIVLASGLVFAQNKNSANLADTLLWMHNFADAHSYWVVEKSEHNPMGIDTTRLTFNRCEVTATLLESGKSIGNTRYSLVDIDPQSLKIETSSNLPGSVAFETTDSRDGIALNISDIWHDSVQEWCKHQLCLSSWLINFDTQENARRFAKAFKHAVSLCGGKPSAF